MSLETSPALHNLPILPDLAISLTDHCNLNCKRCGHFSPIASKVFLEKRDFLRSCGRLRELFRDIGNLSLLGGEPLLHPDLSFFIEASREFFSSAQIYITTNGLLLGKMDPLFWETCRKTGAVIFLSLYPPLASRRGEITRSVEAQGVRIFVQDTPAFFAWMNLRGDSDPQRAFINCKAQGPATFLSDSRLYPCPVPSRIHYFNQHFQVQIPGDPGIDLFDPGMTGKRALDLLNQPIPTCRFCAEEYQCAPWERGSVKMGEWHAAKHP